MRHTPDHHMLPPAPRESRWERIKGLFKELRGADSSAESTESFLHRAYALTQEAEWAGEGTDEYGVKYLQAGELFEQEEEWVDAEGAFARSFSCLKERFPMDNTARDLDNVLAAGQGVERCLYRRGQRAAAMGVHAAVEQLTRVEYDPPLIATRKELTQ